MSQYLHPPVGPDDAQAIHTRRRAETEMGPVIHRRRVAAVGGLVDVLLLPPRREDQRRSDPRPVGRLPRELDLEIVMRIVLGCDILIDECGRVDVIHHEIEPAVVVEIGIGRAVRIAGLVHSPCCGLVGERQVPVVPEDVVGHPVTGQLLQEIQRPSLVTSSACPEYLHLVVEIDGPFGIAVGDDDVFVSIIIEIAEQGAPAPVRVREARQVGDFTEHDSTVVGDAVAHLQRVDVVVVAKSPVTQFHPTALGEVAAHPLASVQGGRHHVHLQNVGPAVVVEIGDINAHTRKTRVLEPRAGPIGKRSIAVVDVEDVIGCDVVGDVEVGPPVPVQVGHRHAESIPELPQYPRFLRYIGECPVAVVAIELVVAGRAVTAYAQRVRVCCTTCKVLR